MPRKFLAGGFHLDIKDVAVRLEEAGGGHVLGPSPDQLLSFLFFFLAFLLCSGSAMLTRSPTSLPSACTTFFLLFILCW